MRTFVVGIALLVAIVAWWFVGAPHDAPPPAAPAPASAATPTAPTPAPSATAAMAAATTHDDDATTRSMAKEGNVVRGVVQQGGTPLANVALRVFVAPGPPAAQQAATTSTDDDGAFTFVMPSARWFFLVDAPTVPRDWWSGWQGERATDWDLGVVHVPRGGAIAGVVRDDAGRPMAEATITAAYGQYERIPLGAAIEPTPLRADATGAFRFDDLRPGSYHVTATTANHALAGANVVVTENGVAPADLVVQRGRRCAGVVLDWRGQPLPGAQVRMESAPAAVTTDARGWFVIEHFVPTKSLHVSAPGHIEDWHDVPYGTDELRISLGRAVTLRGTVRGAGSAPTTILLTEAPDRAPDAADPRPFDLVDKPLPVAADGTFAIEGLSTSDFVVHADAAGVGASPPLRVALRDDTTIEVVIEPRNTLRIVVQDEAGQPIDGAEVVEDPRIGEFPSLYVPSETNDVAARIFTSYRKRSAIAAGGTVVLTRHAGQPFAFGVRHTGHLPQIRVLTADETPAATIVVLARAGRVEGVVRGGSPSEYTRSVTMWAVGDEAKVMAIRRPGAPWSEWRPVSVTVDASGRFTAADLAPGPWRAELGRGNRSNVGQRSDEQVGAVPLIDGGATVEQRIEFTVTAGSTTNLELVDPPLGTLRGRVLLRGAPCADAMVLAVRPGCRKPTGLGRDEPVDWDDDLIRSWVAGQHTASDGSFTFRYRDAGPVELRVRHPKGAATSPPTIVDVPAPGTGDVICTLHLPAGGIRGRLAIDPLPERSRMLRKAILYPMAKATNDPSWNADWVSAVSWSCAKVELPADGRFAFDNLADGDWLVRIQDHAIGSDPGPSWQGVVQVHGDIVDLGDITPPARVATKLAWTWPDGATPGAVLGVWLRRPHRDDAAAVWAGTFVCHENGATCTVPAGKYTVVPFGFHDAGLTWQSGYGLGGVTGEPLAKPFPIEVHADGSVTPRELRFEPLAK